MLKYRLIFFIYFCGFISAQELEEILFFWKISSFSDSSNLPYLNFWVNYWNGSSDYFQLHSIQNELFETDQSQFNLFSLEGIALDSVKDVSFQTPSGGGELGFSQLFLVGNLDNGEYVCISIFPDANEYWIGAGNFLGIRSLPRNPSCCQEYSNQTQYLQFWILLETEDYQSSTVQNPISNLLINGNQINFTLVLNQIRVGEILFVEVVNASVIPTTQNLQIEIQTSAINYWKIGLVYVFGLLSDGFSPPSWTVVVENNFTNSPIEVTMNNPLIVNRTTNSTFCNICGEEYSTESCFNCNNNSVCFPRFSEPINSTLTGNISLL